MSDASRRAWNRGGRSWAARSRRLVWLSVGFLLLGLPALGQTQSPAAPAPAAAEQPDRPGIVSGTIVDQTGAAVGAAHVKLTSSGSAPSQETQSNGDGQFSFANVAPGPFQITIASEGFATQTVTGALNSGQTYVVAQITLPVAAESTQVQVVVPRAEVAEAEMKVEEKQRVFGVVPNFYVSYDPDATPLDSKQKFQLAWRTLIDPVTFGITGAIAGIQQADHDFSGYGQGAAGYGKRYGASYADLVSGTLIGSALLPSVLKQDPRYFYRGTGSKRSRVFYAIANSVICKGDNKHWQPNYSSILGSLAAGGISNLYYPKEDRGAELTFENALIGIGAAAGANLLQEFLIPKLTPNFPKHKPQPQS